MEDIIFDPMEIISEARLSDFGNIESFDENALIDDIFSIHEECEELDFDIVYTEEMVPLFEMNNVFEKNYLVEYENLAKLMKYYENNIGYCDEEMAVKKLSEYYKIPEENIVIVLETQAVYRRMIFNLTEEIKNERNAVRKIRLRKRLKDIKDRLNRLKKAEKLKIIRKKERKRKI